MCGPFSVHARGGYDYFITFTDDYSRYGYVYLMKKKYEALDKFKEFKAKSKKQLGRRIKSFRSDRDGEYMSIEFVSFLKEHGKVNDESFHITFILFGICPRDSSLHSEYGAIQVSTKDTHGNVDRSETYFKSYPHMGLSRLCIKVVI